MPLGHARTAKAQSRLHAQSDQGLRCLLPKSLDTVECSNGEQMPGWDLAHAQDDVYPHVLRMLEGTCSINAAVRYTYKTVNDTRLQVTFIVKQEKKSYLTGALYTLGVPLQSLYIERMHGILLCTTHYWIGQYINRYWAEVLFFAANIQTK